MMSNQSIERQVAVLLLAIRRQRGYSQQKVADKIPGLSREVISYLENGRNKLSMDQFVDICIALEVHPSIILTKVLPNEAIFPDAQTDSLTRKLPDKGLQDDIDPDILVKHLADNMGLDTDEESMRIEELMELFFVIFAKGIQQMHKSRKVVKELDDKVLKKRWYKNLRLHFIELADLELQRKAWMGLLGDHYVSSFIELYSSIAEDYRLEEFIEEEAQFLRLNDAEKRDLKRLARLLDDYEQKKYDEDTLKDPEWHKLVDIAKEVNAFLIPKMDEYIESVEGE